MSYILDALRRADSERERGSVPGIHAQPVPLIAAEAQAATPKPWLWVSAGLAAALIAALGWQMLGRDGANEPPIAAPPVALAPPPPSPPPVAVAPAPVGPPPARVAPATRPPPSAMPAERKPPPVAAAAAPAPVKPAPAEAAAPAPVKPVPIEAAASASRVYAREELPADIQRQLPTFTVGGSVYSPTPAERILIINGQIFHEKDKLAPDLVLEEIKLKAAVLRFKDYRFRMTY